MNAYEQMRQAEAKLAKVINEIGLPLSTIHYMLIEIDRQVIETMSRPIPEEPKTEEGNPEDPQPEEEKATEEGSE